jgi:Transglutaminase-like superfamily
MRRVLTLGIVGSWVVMAALLVQKQAPPSAPSLAAPMADVVAERDEWFAVSADGRKIGHAHRVTARNPSGWSFYEDSVVALSMLGVRQTIRTALTSETDQAFALRRFGFTLISPATTFTAGGTSDGRRLTVAYGPAGQTARLDVPLATPIYLPSTLRPRVLAGDLAPGTHYTVPVFNPLTLANEPMTITVEGREELKGEQGPIRALRLAEEHQGIRTHVWMDADGGVLREEAALGFTIERTSRASALGGDDAAAPLDLVAASRIPLTGTIRDPRGAVRLTLRVAGPASAEIPDALPRQHRTADLLQVTQEPLPERPVPLGARDAPAALAAYLAPAPLVEADDPAIVAEARRIVGDADDVVTAGRRLVAWVHDHLAKEPTVTVPSAREVLASRRGDCNEHAVLLVALARAARIPARLVAGAVYANDGFYYHAWAEMWAGEWISADAVFDQMPVDATHVKLVEGGPERQLALVAVIGRLTFTVEEVSS